jgi:prepilin-type N-terminal cleavage/methylation domain-containing protein
MKSKIRKVKGLTLIEITITICIIGILAVGIVSLSGDRELATFYRAESCINEIDGKIKVFMNAALTSKKLTMKESSGTYTGVFPDYYIIEFSKDSNKITFKYEDKFTSGTYDEILLSGFCKDHILLTLTGTLPFTSVKMNRGFQQIKSNELQSFSLHSGSNINTTSDIYTGAIQVNLC